MTAHTHAHTHTLSLSHTHTGRRKPSSPQMVEVRPAHSPVQPQATLEEEREAGEHSSVAQDIDSMVSEDTQVS